MPGGSRTAWLREGSWLTRSVLLDRIATSKKKAAPVVTLRIPEADLALARKQAERKGLPYQTYIKSLLHETLMEREKRRCALGSARYRGGEYYTGNSWQH